MPPKPGRSGGENGKSGEAATTGLRVEETTAGGYSDNPGTAEEPWDGLMEFAVDRRNWLAALRRVRSNAGGTGIDGMTSWELAAPLKAHWLEIRLDLLAGRTGRDRYAQSPSPSPAGASACIGRK